MAQKLRRIQAVVSADTAPFNKSMEEASGSAWDFANKSSKAYKALDNQLRKLATVSGDVAGNFQELKERSANNREEQAKAKALNDIAKAANLTDAEIKKYAESMGLATQSLGKDASAFEMLGAKIKDLAGPAAIAAAALKSIQFGKESFDLAARYETLGVVVQQVGRVAGYRLPPRPFEMPFCDLKFEMPIWHLKDSHSVLDNWNMKSS